MKSIQTKLSSSGLMLKFTDLFLFWLSLFFILGNQFLAFARRFRNAKQCLGKTKSDSASISRNRTATGELRNQIFIAHRAPPAVDCF
jgi:hypothetical protein